MAALYPDTSSYFPRRSTAESVSTSVSTTWSCLSGDTASIFNSAGTTATSPASEIPGRDVREDVGVKNICFVGGGFVGGPTAAVVAYHNPGITVNVVDLNASRIAAWNSAHLPIYETGLGKVVRVGRDGTKDTSVSVAGGTVSLPARKPNLFFSTDVVPHVAEADMVFICVNTPTKMYGTGAGASADLGFFEAATVDVAKNIKPGTIIVEKSTVPCGTAKLISSILKQYRPNDHFEVLNNPEFLAEGTAVSDLMNPDRVLIGSSNTVAGLEAATVLKSVYAAWVPTQRILNINTFSSELAKLIANAMLAQRISSINAVSALCEELGADVGDVSLAVGADKRIGSRFLQSGIGFGGSCFEKDIRNVSYLARTLHLDAVADYWMGVLDINRYQRERFASTVIRSLNGTLRAKKIAVFGFAFKDGTNDTRNSIAVHVIAQLVAELPREIAIVDPGCAVDEMEDEIRAVVHDEEQLSRIRFYASWADAAAGAAAVCILTPWIHFFTHHRRSSQAKAAAAAATTAASSRKPSSVACPDDDAVVFANQKRWCGQTSWDETDILQLEQQTIRRKFNVDADMDDPLGRLLPQRACADGCQLCETVKNGHPGDIPVDWKVVARSMVDSKWVFDGRHVVDSGYLESLGFKVHCIGKGY